MPQRAIALEATSASILEEMLHEVISGNHPRILIDLNDLHFTSAAGFGAVIVAQSAAWDAGGRIVLYRPSSAVRAILDTLNVAAMFSITQDREEALHLLKSSDVPIRALIVDDSPITRRMIRAAMESAGIDEILEAEDGNEALALLGILPRIVTLDLRMPKFSGTDFLRATRELPVRQPIPVLVVTASEQEELEREGILDQVAAVVRKPINIDELTEQIRELLISPTA